MYPGTFRYFRPATLQECFDLLNHLGDTSRVLAGGQTLIPMLKLRVDAPTAVVDISRIQGLDSITSEEGWGSIGALATHNRIARSRLAEAVLILRDCAEGIADVQVRNMGTIGGSLSVADPSSDWPTVLHAIDAEVECSSQSGTRVVPLDEFIVDAYTTSLGNAEIVTRVRLRLPEGGSGGAYVGYKKAAPAYQTAAAGAQLTLSPDGSCRQARLVLGSAGTKAVVSEKANLALEGQKLTDRIIEQAAELCVEASSPVADSRGSVEFKKALLKTLVVEAVSRAERRANGEVVSGGHMYV